MNQEPHSCDQRKHFSTIKETAAEDFPYSGLTSHWDIRSFRAKDPDQIKFL